MTMQNKLNPNRPLEAKSERGVLCVKCDHLNPPTSKHCTACGSHLHVACHKCGKQSPRVLTRCPHCGFRLHRSFWRRWQRRLLKRRGRFNPVQLGLAIALAFLTYKIIVMLVEFKAPAPQ
jgi:hypothetical protein